MTGRFATRIAEAYGSHSEKYASVLEPMLQPMADEIAALARLEGGESILDLATGTGLIARSVAQFTGSVAGLDISAGILRRALSLSAGEIPFVAGDAAALPFRDGCFDLVTCGLSLSHFPDVAVALREVLRVLRPGGRFITSAWGSEGKSPAKAAAVKVRDRFLDEREQTFGGPFDEAAWEVTERGVETLVAAGFADVRASTLSLSGAYPDTTAAIEAALAWPITRYRIARLDPADQRKLKEETAAAIAEVDDLRWRSELHIYQGAKHK